MVIRPSYVFDQRLLIDVEEEDAVPPASLYIEVGHDRAAGSGDKHYRRYFPDELEQVTENGQFIIETPFRSEPVSRAEKPADSGLFANLFGGDTRPMQLQRVGSFKGLIRCFEPAEYKKKVQELEGQVIQIEHTIKAIFEYEKAASSLVKTDYDFSL